MYLGPLSDEACKRCSVPYDHEQASFGVPAPIYNDGIAVSSGGSYPVPNPSSLPAVRAVMDAAFRNDHTPLLHGQPVDDISGAQLEAEYGWACQQQLWDYARQLRTLREYKDRQAASDQSRRKAVQEALKPAVNMQRVCDADRNRYSDHLSTLYQQGYIDQGEFERLNGKALEARTKADLGGLLENLPALPSEKYVPAQREPEYTAWQNTYHYTALTALVALVFMGLAFCFYLVLGG